MASLTGAEIQRAREEQGMSRAELGYLVGVGERTIGYWETGSRAPTFHHEQRIRAVLLGQGVPAAELDVPTRIAVLERRVAALQAVVDRLAAARLGDDPQT